MYLRPSNKRVNYAVNGDDEEDENKENLPPQPPPPKRRRGRPRRSDQLQTQAQAQLQPRVEVRQPLSQHHPNSPTTTTTTTTAIAVRNSRTTPTTTTTIREKLISLLQLHDQKKNGEKGPHGRAGARKNPKDLSMLEFTSLESLLRIAACGGTIQDMKNRAEQDYRNHPSPRAQLKWLPRFLGTIFNKTLYCMVTHKDVVSKINMVESQSK